MKLSHFILTVILLLPSQAIPASVYIVYPENRKGYAKIAEKIKENLSEKRINETFIVNPEELKKKQFKENDLTVFLGKHDTEEYSSIKASTIFSFTNSAEAKKDQKWSVVSANQPAKKLLGTAKKAIVKEYRKSILFIISEDNEWAKKQLDSIKNTQNVKVITIKKGDTAAKVIEPELENTAAIVALHDTFIWSGNSARWILQRAYSHKVPIIGYSKAFLKAGAMASVYSSADQIIEETEKHILQWSKTGRLNNKINYPEYTIEVNNNIAKALNFSNMEIIELGKKQ